LRIDPSFFDRCHHSSLVGSHLPYTLTTYYILPTTTIKASSVVAGKVFVAVLLLRQQLCCITHAFIAPTHHGVVLRPSLSSYHPTSSFASFYLHQRQVTLSVASPIMMDYDKTAVTTFLIQTVISTAVPTTAVIVTMLVLATLIFRDKKNSGAMVPTIIMMRTMMTWTRMICILTCMTTMIQSKMVVDSFLFSSDLYLDPKRTKDSI